MRDKEHLISLVSEQYITVKVLRRILDNAGYSTENNVEQGAEILVTRVTGDDDIEREMSIQLIPSSLIASQFGWEQNVTALQLFHILPFEVASRAEAELHKLLNNINLGLPIPAFGFHHDHQILYYRASVPLAPNKPVDASTFLATLRLAAQLIESFEPLIWTVATGESSYDGLIDESVSATADDLLEREDKDSG